MFRLRCPMFRPTAACAGTGSVLAVSGSRLSGTSSGNPVSGSARSGPEPGRAEPNPTLPARHRKNPFWKRKEKLRPDDPETQTFKPHLFSAKGSGHNATQKLCSPKLNLRSAKPFLHSPDFDLHAAERHFHSDEFAGCSCRFNLHPSGPATRNLQLKLHCARPK